MTILQIFILIISIAAVALIIGYFTQRQQKSLAQLTEVYYDNESQQLPEVDIAQQLYDKDLREVTPHTIDKVVQISKRTPPGAVLDIKTVIHPPKSKNKTKTHRTKKQ